METKIERKWIQEDDKNTKFFHLSTVIKRQNNAIHSIKIENHTWINDRKEINSYFINNFQKVVTTTDLEIPTNLEQLMPRSITNQEGMSLIKISNHEEIKRTLFEIANVKASSPNARILL